MTGVQTCALPISGDYSKPLEISHWDALQRLKSLFEWPMAATLSLESDEHVIVGRTLKYLTKLIDRLLSIGDGFDEGVESRTVMVPANGMWLKLKEELANDGAMLLGLLFLAYLDIGGEHISVLYIPSLYMFSFFVSYMYFLLVSCLC